VIPAVLLPYKDLRPYARAAWPECPEPCGRVALAAILLTTFSTSAPSPRSRVCFFALPPTNRPPFEALSFFVLGKPTVSRLVLSFSQPFFLIVFIFRPFPTVPTYAIRPSFFYSAGHSGFLTAVWCTLTFSDTYSASFSTRRSVFIFFLLLLPGAAPCLPAVPSSVLFPMQTSRHPLRRLFCPPKNCPLSAPSFSVFDIGRSSQRGWSFPRPLLRLS